MRGQFSIKATTLDIALAKDKLSEENFFLDANAQIRLTLFEEKKYQLFKFSILLFPLIFLLHFIV